MVEGGGREGVGLALRFQFPPTVTRRRFCRQEYCFGKFCLASFPPYAASRRREEGVRKQEQEKENKKEEKEDGEEQKTKRKGRGRGSGILAGRSSSVRAQQVATSLYH